MEKKGVHGVYPKDTTETIAWCRWRQVHVIIWKGQSAVFWGWG